MISIILKYKGDQLYDTLSPNNLVENSTGLSISEFRESYSIDEKRVSMQIDIAGELHNSTDRNIVIPCVIPEGTDFHRTPILLYFDHNRRSFQQVLKYQTNVKMTESNVRIRSISIDLPEQAVATTGAFRLRITAIIQDIAEEPGKRPSIIHFDARNFKGGVKRYVVCLRTSDDILSIASPAVAVDGSDVLIDYERDLLVEDETVSISNAENRCRFENSLPNDRVLEVAFSDPDPVSLLFFADPLTEAELLYTYKNDSAQRGHRDLN